MKDFIIISMFTKDTPYEKDIDILSRSIDRYNIKYDIIGKDNTGNWIKNTYLKALTIKDAMNKYKIPVVWIDIDAKLVRYPDFFFNMNGEISYFKFDNYEDILTGTLYFAYTDNCKRIIDDWININSTSDVPDASNFLYVINKFKRNKDITLKYIPLPVEYVNIIGNDLTKSNNPVIIHNNASKRYGKLLIKNKQHGNE